MKVIIEPQYLPSLECFSIFAQSESISWDTQSFFRKQTFRNRCYILGANKVQQLNVPVHYKQKMPFDEVKIDYSQSWRKDHWGAIYSSYGKSPFFEYFAEEFSAVYDKAPETLLALNHEMLSVCFKLLQWQNGIEFNFDEKEGLELRDVLSPKSAYQNRPFYQPFGYQQNFGNTFAPNLSILDLLFCQGPASGEVLKKSIKTAIERFRT